MATISIHAPPRGATAGRGGSRRASSFQFTPLREGRHAQPAEADGSNHFNSRPSARGDARLLLRLSCRHHFNSRPSARGDLCAVRNTIKNGYFNSRPSARGDIFTRDEAAALFEFQFTPLREGRHKQLLRSFCPANISIHAPPRGATSLHQDSLMNDHFNSRPSARGDLILRLIFLLIVISIHAPPRGATGKLTQLESSFNISIHAPPRGATRCIVHREGSGIVFQFTPLREGRLVGTIKASPPRRYFNSRPSARGDSSKSTPVLGKLYFNSRPSARGDVTRPSIDYPAGHFNSRPSARGDPCPTKLACAALYFNSRPSARGDDIFRHFVRAGNISIHAPPRGATSVFNRFRGYIRISIHAPPRGATI